MAMSERLSGSKAKGELLAGEPTAEPPPRPEKPAYHVTGDELPAALEHLRDERRWVAWDYEWRNGRWTKPPRDPRTGGYASVADPATWGTFTEALAGTKQHGHAGVGLVLTDDGDIIGIDLDDCVNDAGSFTPLAAEIIGYGESYAEVSPSGEGIRILIRGKIERALKDNALGVEVYSTGALSHRHR
jgi:primase-polymerase (primpol)-like protein